MRRLIAAPFIALMLIACDTYGIVSTVEVRVENASPVAFDHVSYWAGNEELQYPTLTSGQATPYVEADGAYGYTTVQVVVGVDTTRLQVIDFVGETPLSSGRYTYVLGLEGEAGSRSLTQALRRDP